MGSFIYIRVFLCGHYATAQNVAIKCPLLQSVTVRYVLNAAQSIIRMQNPVPER
jgi:hypothetical protein